MKYLVFLLMLSVSACASGRPATDSACGAFRPIRPLPADIAAMSDTLAGQLLSHNETGARLCGWRP